MKKIKCRKNEVMTKGRKRVDGSKVRRVGIGGERTQGKGGEVTAGRRQESGTWEGKQGKV